MKHKTTFVMMLLLAGAALLSEARAEDITLDSAVRMNDSDGDPHLDATIDWDGSTVVTEANQFGPKKPSRCCRSVVAMRPSSRLRGLSPRRFSGKRCVAGRLRSIG